MSTEVVSTIDGLIAQWPSDPKEAQQKLKALADKFRQTKLAINPNEILKVHPTGSAKQEEENDRYEIFLVYTKTGKKTAELLKGFFEKDCTPGYYTEFFADGAQFDPVKLEETVANSILVVFLLTDATLFEPAVIFAMEAVQKKEYKGLNPVLVHDASSCYFPGGEQQAESIKHLFAEKAVSLLPDYITVSVDDVVIRLEEYIATIMSKDDDGKKDKPTAKSTLHKHNLILLQPKPDYTCQNCQEEKNGKRFHCVLCQFDLCSKCAKETKEDIKTHCFLSHKRTTAQVIAGRLYEGLKDDYKVFLDSEAKFKIHDLELIVENTGLLVLILSAGYLESYWCCQELRAALKYKKPVLVVRDITYKLPPRESLGKEFDDIKSAIYDSPAIVWVAEYNTPCLKMIKNKYLGPPNETINDFHAWWKLHAKEVVKKLNEDGTLDLTGYMVQRPEKEAEEKGEDEEENEEEEEEEDDDDDTTYNSLEDTIRAFAHTQKALVPKVKRILLENMSVFEDEDDVMVLTNLPNVEYIDLTGCDIGGNLKLLGRACPHIKKLDLDLTDINDMMFVGMIRKLEKLEELNIYYCSNLSGWSLDMISEKCKNLKKLVCGGCDFSEEEIAEFKKTLPNCEVDDTDAEPDEEEDEEAGEEEKEEKEDEEAEEDE